MAPRARTPRPPYTAARISGTFTPWLIACRTRGSRGPLRDPRVRQAINHGVNVPEILAAVYGGRGVLARGAIPPGLAGSDTTRRRDGYDPAGARALIADAD